MKIQLQLIDGQSRKLPAGLQFTLLHAGNELARETSDDAGFVSFEFDSDETDGLSVRLVGVEKKEPDVDRAVG